MLANLTIFLCSMLLAAAIALPAEAQNRGAFSSQNDEDEILELDTVVVTTRRTEELLEEVPGSVVVFPH